MLFFKWNGSQVTEVSSDYPKDFTGWRDRNDFEDLADAQMIASSAAKVTGKQYLATDAGEWTSPRYDVIEAPKVGDQVSYAFNGDYYPDGEIISISGSFRVIRTSTGHTYYRRRQSAAWIQQGGTWSLVPGHISRLNREF